MNKLEFARQREKFFLKNFRGVGGGSYYVRTNQKILEGVCVCVVLSLRKIRQKKLRKNVRVLRGVRKGILHNHGKYS